MPVIDVELKDRIRTAFEAGVHYRDIMAAAGLSQGRVYQIAKSTRAIAIWMA